MQVITKTEILLKLHSRGKVRDTYELGADLLMVASDRLSAPYLISLSLGLSFSGQSFIFFVFIIDFSMNVIAQKDYHNRRCF